MLRVFFGVRQVWRGSDTRGGISGAQAGSMLKAKHWPDQQELYRKQSQWVRSKRKDKDCLS